MEMTMRYASTGDKVIFFSAVIAIVIYSSTRPLFSFLMGTNTSATSDTAHAKEEHKSYEQPLRMVILGVVAWFFRFIMIGGLQVFSTNITHKLKMNYFKSVLGKDSAWFDANNPNEMGTKIVKEA
jgi:hypothetical protein